MKNIVSLNQGVSVNSFEYSEETKNAIRKNVINEIKTISFFIIPVLILGIILSFSIFY